MALRPIHYTLITLVAVLGLIPVAHAQDSAISMMPASQQTALVKKYCAVCHTDGHLNGGLSLEHFDAANADPGVVAMLISKMASGMTPDQVSAARQQDPATAALIAKTMKTGAMAASGVPEPDSATGNALVSALAAEATGYTDWSVRATQDPATQVKTFSASIVQEVPSAKNNLDTAMYRLTVSCRVNADAGTHEGEILLAWAPGSPPAGKAISATMDGKEPVSCPLENEKNLFKGAIGTMGIGGILLSSKTLPAQSLTVNNLFEDGNVAFPFSKMTATTRRELSACFTGSTY